MTPDLCTCYNFTFQPLYNEKINDNNEKNSITPEDNLLENVTNRTEALVNQSTSFNRFRPKFKSTLENSS